MNNHNISFFPGAFLKCSAIYWLNLGCDKTGEELCTNISQIPLKTAQIRAVRLPKHEAKNRIKKFELLAKLWKIFTRPSTFPQIGNRTYGISSVPNNPRKHPAWINGTFRITTTNSKWMGRWCGAQLRCAFFDSHSLWYNLH